MKYLIIIILLATASGLNAQVKYQGRIEGGVLNGNWKTSGYVQTVHGIRYKQWFAGVGTGMDYYRYTTLPVFAEMRKEFGKKNVKPFVVAAAGVSFPWLNEQQKQQDNVWWQGNSSTYHKGFYSHAGIGVVLNADKEIRYAITVAYSYKTLSRTYVDWIFDPWPQPTNTTEKTMEYRLNRLSIGFSVVF